MDTASSRTLLEELCDHLVLGGRLEGDEVHAVLPADVPGLQPVVLLVGVLGDVAGVEVVLPVVFEVNRPCSERHSLYARSLTID